ncbi:EAL domain-containing protein [Candidatus Sarmatiella mevalonica]|uniref:EAL domain-containing protein n=1 Tax=Candidatus Sarmatiella mevalonica TaxID=2770581 RepID=UPI001921A0C6|nr:EAL domain-containing protein [Candidatus Sarmatiella mevalonica]
MQSTQLRALVQKFYWDAQLHVFNDPKSYINLKIVSKDEVSNGNTNDVLDVLSSLACASTRHHHYFSQYNEWDIGAHSVVAKGGLVSLLRNAIKLDQLQFFYQPIINYRENKIYYHECLLRIQDEHNNLFSIGEIIDSVEEQGLMNILDYKVFNMGISQLLANPNMQVSVNISSLGVLDDAFLDFAQELLSLHKVGNRLIIEITETTLNLNLERTTQFVHALKAQGCRIALDDFGAGFTSFKQLEFLPIDIIKIDGSYIRNLDQNIYHQYFVEMMTFISNKINVLVIAEFVETQEVCNHLTKLGIQYMQGHLFARASSIIADI